MSFTDGLPRFATVVGVREVPSEGAYCDEFRPYYAVDIQLLDQHGNDDAAVPVMRDVPIAKGVFHSLPKDGERVEVGFAYGSPNNPFIRCTLPHGQVFKPIGRDETMWEHGNAQYQRCDDNGNWERVTDAGITDKSVQRDIEAMTGHDKYTQYLADIEAEYKLNVGVATYIKAQSLVQLLSGGRFDIGAMEDVNISSNTAQKLKAPKTWLGSESVNVLAELSRLADTLKSLCDKLATHTHPNVGAMSNGGEVTILGTTANNIKNTIDSISN